MQEMDDERLAAGGEELLDRRLHFVFVKRRAYRTRGFDAFRHFQAEVARNDRDKSTRHAVGLRARAAAELDDIAKAARGDHAGARKPALQHGVGGGRGAVDDEVDVAGAEAGFAERSNHAEGLVVGSGRHLGDANAAAVACVDQDQVGEGAADIDAGDDAALSRPGYTPLSLIFLSHARNPKRRT